METSTVAIEDACSNEIKSDDAIAKIQDNFKGTSNMVGCGKERSKSGVFLAFGFIEKR